MVGPTGRGARAVALNRAGPLLSVAMVVVAVDLATKAAVVATLHEGQQAPVLALGKAVTVTLARGSGGPLVVLTALLAVLAVLVAIGVLLGDRRFRSAGWPIASGLVLGGVLGNLADRFVRTPSPAGRYVVDFLSVLGSPAFNLADVSLGLGAALMLVLAVRGSLPDATDPQDDQPDRSSDLDPDDEKVALLHRPKYPTLKWDPMPGKPRYLPSLADEEQPSDPEDPDDLVDEDDRLPGRTRHPANKWER